MSAKKKTSDYHKKKLETVLSIVLPVLVFLGMAAYLVYYLLYHSPIVLTDDSFYRQALVLSGQSAFLTTYDIAGLYVYLLHMMLLVFGNTPFGGIVLQIVLLFICLLLVYIGMQAYTSSIPAAISMVVLGVTSVFWQYVFSLTPELFILTLCLLGFCFTGIVYRGAKRHRERAALRKAETNADQDSKEDKDKNKKEQEKPAPGEPLHNPFPVPKKKVRLMMDFGHPVKEADMKFDINIKDGDDFDR